MKLTVELKERSYPIVIERGALARAGELFRLERRVLIVTDEGVPAAYAETVARLSGAPCLMTVPEGEGSKSFAVLEQLLSRMLTLGFGRGDAVVAVGGGVVGDLSALAASLYMRGIDFYNIPTTLLSAVDSSVGGKTAVNLGGVKNVVGTFFQPKGVLIDPDLLLTLDPREFRSGLAEVLKMGMTTDRGLVAMLEEASESGEITALSPLLPELIARSLEIKKSVVEQDEREGGLRRILNFGHTLGHGIEASEGGRRSHGECVALGMLPMTTGEARAQLLSLLPRLGLAGAPSASPEAVFSAMAHDKKKTEGGFYAVTVDRVGQGEILKMKEEELKRRYLEVYGQ